MRTVTETYEEVASYQDGSKLCKTCNKKFRRTFKEFQTINPWNNKTRAEIIAENEIALYRYVLDWEADKEQCPACVKAGIPDVVLDVITQEDWDATQALRDEIASLGSIVHQKKSLLEASFKGKHIELTLKGKPRYGVVDYFHPDGAWTSFQYTLLRKDLKGETGTTDQIRPHNLFNIPDERGST